MRRTSSTPSEPQSMHAIRTRKRNKRRLRWLTSIGVVLTLWWSGVVPWTGYVSCGTTKPASLPTTIRVGLYEEFPVPWRLEKLRQLDFPVSLAIAAPSQAAFTALREQILAAYPQVREVYFWPVLSQAEGYYPGAWSNAAAVQRVAMDGDGLPLLWDAELPRNRQAASLGNWRRNRAFMDAWLRERTMPVHVWRSYAAFGLNTPVLQLLGLHIDPRDHPHVSLHLDLYATDSGLPQPLLSKVIRCGVEQYGDRFVPSLGVLNDGEGTPEQFISPTTLRRDLTTARVAGVHEVWLFGANGLNADYLAALHDTLPLEGLP